MPSSKRLIAASRIAGTNRSCEPPPRAFAVYIAVSASRSRSAAVSPSSATAMPTLARSATSTPPTASGGTQGDRDPIGDLVGVRGIGDVLEQERELVAAEAGHRVAGADRRAQPLADLLEHAVARLVPEAVVDRLEVVEVHEQDDHARGAAGRAASARATRGR